MTTKVVVFDMYGTLVSVKNRTNPYKLLFGIRRDLHGSFLTCNFSDIGEVCRSMDLTLPQEMVQKIEDGIAREVASVVAYADVFQTLQWLKEEGYKLGLISNLATPYKYPFFGLGLDKFIDYYAFSCDAGCAKPDQKIYQTLLEKLNVVSDEVLMVGDSITADVVGPKAFGFNAILLDRDGSKDWPEKIESLEDLKAKLKAC